MIAGSVEAFAHVNVYKIAYASKGSSIDRDIGRDTGRDTDRDTDTDLMTC